MKILKKIRTPIAFFMAFLLSNISVAFGEVAASPQMLSTQMVLQEMSRKDAEDKVKDFMTQEEVKNALIERGLSQEEATTRIAALSDSEIQQLATQVDQAKAGGDILVTVLLVVLIIFLVKRI